MQARQAATLSESALRVQPGIASMLKGAALVHRRLRLPFVISDVELSGS